MLSERGELGLEAVQKRVAEPCGGQSACSAVDARHPQGARMRWIALGSRFADARSQREDIGMKLKFLATMEGIRDGPDADTSDSLVFGPRGHRWRTCCFAMVTRARWCSLQLRRAPHALCYCLHFAPCTRLCRRRLALRRGSVASGLPAISGEIEEACSSISTIRRT